MELAKSIRGDGVNQSPDEYTLLLRALGQASAEAKERAYANGLPYVAEENQSRIDAKTPLWISDVIEREGKVVQSDRPNLLGSLLRVTLTTLSLGIFGLLAYSFFYPDASSLKFDSTRATVIISVAVVVAFARFALFHASSLPLSRRVLVLGVGRDAVLVKEALDIASVRGLSIVGFHPIDAEQEVDAALPVNHILPSSKSIGEIARQLDVSEIILATRERRGGTFPLKELLNCKLQGIKVTDLSAFFEQYHSKVRIDLLRESWFIFGGDFRQQPMRMFVKRIFDIVGASALIVFSLPLMAVAAILIKLNSPGPVLYRQERVGLGGKSFYLPKFRSKLRDVESDGKPQWAEEGDPRVTSVGRFLRLTRIDELPQFYSVLKGDMSLVGPRPERPYFVDQLVQQIPFYGARHSVKPGVTGWAQVRHHYGASVDDSSDKLQYDLYYVKNHSLFFDILVLLYSVKAVLLAHGAR